MEKTLRNCLSKLNLRFVSCKIGNVTAFTVKSNISEYAIGYNASEGKYFVCEITKSLDVVDLYVNKDRYKALYALSRCLLKDSLKHLQLREDVEHELEMMGKF